MTKRKTPSWLEILILLSIPVVIVITGFAGPGRSDHNNYTDQAWLLGQVTALERQLDTFTIKAAHYLEHAPRNYDSFFRDSIITHAHLRADLTNLKNSISAVVPDEDHGFPEPALTANSFNQSGMQAHIQQVEGTWLAFSRGLEEQLGVDPEVPRLEWGARHIVEESGPLLSSVTSFQEALRGSVAMAAPSAHTARIWAWPALIIWLLVAASWLVWRKS
ncbi:MAG: hypothetical protein EA370_15860 [Wenzhouxiangella sp.]|nr:MAG: hypothetical protein EA370_15860 [Wenzhouxiangella sp.]